MFYYNVLIDGVEKTLKSWQNLFMSWQYIAYFVYVYLLAYFDHYDHTR
jgi:hypothetical protein